MPAVDPAKLFHRFPFVLTDRDGRRSDTTSASSRLVSIDDSLHEGGAGGTFAQVLLVEAIAQTAALFVRGAGGRRSGMLVGLRRLRFGRAPRPGDRLVVEARLVQKFGDIVRIEGRVVESGSTLAQGEVLISLSGGTGE